jgi:hypothetical protein
VLSPRRFLSQKERLIPRHDQRKKKLRVHIQQALKGSRRYLDFEKKMEEKGYQVIKGRGIAFIDDKKVKIKGSEVNYSLQIIERILEKQRIQELRQDPTYRQQQQQKISRARKVIGKSLGKQLNHAVNLEQGAAIAGELTGGFANVMAVLMKHEQSHGSLPAELRQESRKKKKRQRHHW